MKLLLRACSLQARSNNLPFNYSLSYECQLESEPLSYYSELNLRFRGDKGGNFSERLQTNPAALSKWRKPAQRCQINGYFPQYRKKYCEGEKVPWERKTPEREASVLTEDVLAFISSCLEEDEAEGLKKQRHTARRIYDRLVEEKGFEGGESTIIIKNS